MNKREAAIVSAYTGFMLGDFSRFHGYVEYLFDRPVYTHEFGDHAFMMQVKNAAKHDFCNIEITDDNASETHSDGHKYKMALDLFDADSKGDLISERKLLEYLNVLAKPISDSEFGHGYTAAAKLIAYEAADGKFDWKREL